MKHTTRGQYGVEFPLTRLDQYDVRYRGLEIRQKIRQHDIATVRVRTSGLRWLDAFSTGTPVRIRYTGQNHEKGTFTGYVTNVRPVLADDEGQYTRDIVCVAASRGLRRTGRATYRNRTAPEIVAIVGREAGFDVVTTPHGLRRPTVSHNGETYWEFLSLLAKRSGYVLRVEGTTIMFLPLPDMVRAYMSRAPFLTDYGSLATVGYEPPNVFSVDAWAGDASDDPDSLSDSVTYTAVEPDTGRVHVARQTPSSATDRRSFSRSQYERYPSDVVAHSREDARLLAKGAADNGMMAFDTRLTASGDSLLRPYRPVILDMKDASLNGTWVVKEAVHRMSKGTYSCDLVVSTESVTGGAASGARGRRARRDLGAELAQGFSPDYAARSRLRVTATTPGSVGTGVWVPR